MNTKAANNQVENIDNADFRDWDWDVIFGTNKYDYTLCTIA